MRPQYLRDAPEFGEVVSIANGIDWLRLPLPMALDHLNVYILRDDDGVTVVDTGLNYGPLRDMWTEVIAKFIAPEPIKRVLITHYHPDHIGLAGWFVEEHGAQLITSRMSYLLTRMLQLDVQERPNEHHKRYWQRAGYDAEWIAKRMAKRPFNFIDSTVALPLGVRTLNEGDLTTLAGRNWITRFGQGHAPDHVTLWHDDFAIIGDHCLPAITPVISVFPTEPDADPLGEFVRASERLAKTASDEQVFLCGHNRPFTGGRSRLLALAAHHHEALGRIREALREPKTMIDCYHLLFKRKITPDVEGFAISEATAHFNHLAKLSEIEMFNDDDGIIRWRLA